MRILLSTLLLLTCPASAQVKQCAVTIPVTVRAEDKRGPGSLESENFVVRIGDLGARSQLLMRPKDATPRVALLLDTSGSMKSKWGLAQSVAINFIRLLEPADELALVAYSDSITGRVPLTRNRDAIIGAVEHATLPAGRTALLDTIARTIKEVPLGRGDVIVIISDSEENRSGMHENEVRDLLTLSGVRVFGIWLYDPNFPTPAEIAGLVLLKELPDITGGDTTEISPADLRVVGNPPRADTKSAAHLMKELTRIAMAVDHPLLLRVAWPLPSGGAKPLKLKVEVVDHYGHRIKDLTVRYPERITGCLIASDQASVPAKPN